MITGVRLPWLSYKNNLGSIGTDHIGPKFAIFRIMIGRYDVFLYLKAASIDDDGISEQDGFCNERTKGCCEPDFRRKRLYNVAMRKFVDNAIPVQIGILISEGR
jgi:hypothetical protein